ncbi:hypothetical protein ACI3PL_20265, partial [Lacticaseibacillus paracasei]
ITQIVLDMWDWIVGLYNRAKDQINTFIELVKDIWHGKWTEVWEDVKHLFSNAWDGIVDIVTSVGGRLFDAAKAVGKKIWEGIVDGTTGAANAV